MFIHSELSVLSPTFCVYTNDTCVRDWSKTATADRPTFVLHLRGGKRLDGVNGFLAKNGKLFYRSTITWVAHVLLLELSRSVSLKNELTLCNSNPTSLLKAFLLPGACYKTVYAALFVYRPRRQYFQTAVGFRLVFYRQLYCEAVFSKPHRLCSK